MAHCLLPLLVPTLNSKLHLLTIKIKEPGDNVSLALVELYNCYGPRRALNKLSGYGTIFLLNSRLTM